MRETKIQINGGIALETLFKPVILGIAMVAACAGEAHADPVRKPAADILAVANAETTYVFNSAAFIYALEDNASGYRVLTSVEPEAGERLPLSGITVYPESQTPDGLELTYIEEEGPAIQGRATTVMVHANIPLKP